MREVALDYSPLFILYKDGGVDRLTGNDVVPPSVDDPNVKSKDVVYSQQANMSARLYLPKTDHKLPVLIYFHGGGFVIESAFSPMYHGYLKQLAEEARVVVVSVHYRRAPEHPLPAAYDDSWEAINWVVSHSNGNGEEEWLNLHGDFGRVFLGGESAGANIAYNMGMRYGHYHNKLEGANLVGIALVQPFFWGEKPIGSEADGSLRRMLGDKSVMDKLWPLVCPGTSGCDDPWINPAFEPNLAKLGGSRVLVNVAGKDLLRDRGWYFYETLRKSGWGGKLEILETKGEDHVFHFFNPHGENARLLGKKFVGFLNQAKA